MGGDGGAIAAPSDPSSAAAGIACEEMSDEEAVRMPEDALISQNWHSEEEMAYAEGLCENEEEEMSVHKMAGLEAASMSQNCHGEDEMAHAEGLCEYEEAEMSVYTTAMEVAGLEAERRHLAKGAGGGNPVNAVAAVGTDGELPCLLLGLIHLTASTLADWQASADWQACPNYRLPDWSKPRFVSCADYRRIPSAAQAL